MLAASSSWSLGDFRMGWGAEEVLKHGLLRAPIG